MGWREKMGAAEKVNSEAYTQNTLNAQKGVDGGVSADSAYSAYRDENEKAYPIPTDELEFAEDERQAIIEFDGGGGQDADDELIQMAMDIFQGQIKRR